MEVADGDRVLLGCDGGFASCLGALDPDVFVAPHDGVQRVRSDVDMCLFTVRKVSAWATSADDRVKSKEQQAHLFGSAVRKANAGAPSADGEGVSGRLKSKEQLGLVFGSIVQLEHCASRQMLGIHRGRQNGRPFFKLSTNPLLTRASTLFRVSPKFKIKQDGEAVRSDDRVLLYSEAARCFAHTTAADSLNGTQFTFRVYDEARQHTTGEVCVGTSALLFHKEREAFLDVEAGIAQLSPVPVRDSTLNIASLRYPSSSLWLLEHANVLEGGAVRTNEDNCRIKHTATGKYLCADVSGNSVVMRQDVSTNLLGDSSLWTLVSTEQHNGLALTTLRSSTTFFRLMNRTAGKWLSSHHSSPPLASGSAATASHSSPLPAFEDHSPEALQASERGVFSSFWDFSMRATLDADPGTLKPVSLQLSDSLPYVDVFCATTVPERFEYDVRTMIGLGKVLDVFVTPRISQACAAASLGPADTASPDLGRSAGSAPPQQESSAPSSKVRLLGDTQQQQHSSPVAATESVAATLQRALDRLIAFCSAAQRRAATTSVRNSHELSSVAATRAARSRGRSSAAHRSRGATGASAGRSSIALRSGDSAGGAAIRGESLGRGGGGIVDVSLPDVRNQATLFEQRVFGSVVAAVLALFFETPGNGDTLRRCPDEFGGCAASAFTFLQMFIRSSTRNCQALLPSLLALVEIVAVSAAACGFFTEFAAVLGLPIRVLDRLVTICFEQNQACHMHLLASVCCIRGLPRSSIQERILERCLTEASVVRTVPRLVGSSLMAQLSREVVLATDYHSSVWTLLAACLSGRERTDGCWIRAAHVAAVLSAPEAGGAVAASPLVMVPMIRLATALFSTKRGHLAHLRATFQGCEVPAAPSVSEDEATIKAATLQMLQLVLSAMFFPAPSAPPTGGATQRPHNGDGRADGDAAAFAGFTPSPSATLRRTTAASHGVGSSDPPNGRKNRRSSLPPGMPPTVPSVPLLPPSSPTEPFGPLLRELLLLWNCILWNRCATASDIATILSLVRMLLQCAASQLPRCGPFHWSRNNLLLMECVQRAAAILEQVCDACAMDAARVVLTDLANRGFVVPDLVTTAASGGGRRSRTPSTFDGENNGDGGAAEGGRTFFGALASLCVEPVQAITSEADTWLPLLLSLAAFDHPQLACTVMETSFKVMSPTQNVARFLPVVVLPEALPGSEVFLLRLEAALTLMSAHSPTPSTSSASPLLGGTAGVSPAAAASSSRALTSSGGGSGGGSGLGSRFGSRTLSSSSHRNLLRAPVTEEAAMQRVAVALRELADAFIADGARLVSLPVAQNACWQCGFVDQLFAFFARVPGAPLCNPSLAAASLTLLCALVRDCPANALACAPHLPVFALWCCSLETDSLRGLFVDFAERLFQFPVLPDDFDASLLVAELLPLSLRCCTAPPLRCLLGMLHHAPPSATAPIVACIEETLSAWLCFDLGDAKTAEVAELFCRLVSACSEISGSQQIALDLREGFGRLLRCTAATKDDHSFLSYLACIVSLYFPGTSVFPASSAQPNVAIPLSLEPSSSFASFSFGPGGAGSFGAITPMQLREAQETLLPRLRHMYAGGSSGGDRRAAATATATDALPPSPPSPPSPTAASSNGVVSASSDEGASQLTSTVPPPLTRAVLTFLWVALRSPATPTARAESQGGSSSGSRATATASVLLGRKSAAAAGSGSASLGGATAAGSTSGRVADARAIFHGILASLCSDSHVAQLSIEDLELLLVLLDECEELPFRQTTGSFASSTGFFPASVGREGASPSFVASSTSLSAFTGGDHASGAYSSSASMFAAEDLTGIVHLRLCKALKERRRSALGKGEARGSDKSVHSSYEVRGSVDRTTTAGSSCVPDVDERWPSVRARILAHFEEPTPAQMKPVLQLLNAGRQDEYRLLRIIVGHLNNTSLPDNLIIDLMVVLTALLKACDEPVEGAPVPAARDARLLGQPGGVATGAPLTKSQMQCLLDELGATPLTSTLLEHHSRHVVVCAVEFGKELLDGGNRRCQDALIDFFGSHDEKFFFTIRNVAKEEQRIMMTTKDDLLFESSASLVLSLCRLLQLLCEGHHLGFQNYVRVQHDNYNSYNMCSFLMEILHNIATHLSPRLLPLANQVLNTLTEFCQGPCLQNQATIVSCNVVSEVNSVLSYDFDSFQQQNARRPPSTTSSNHERAKEHGLGRRESGACEDQPLVGSRDDCGATILGNGAAGDDDADFILHAAGADSDTGERDDTALTANEMAMQLKCSAVVTLLSLLEGSQDATIPDLILANVNTHTLRALLEDVWAQKDEDDSLLDLGFNIFILGSILVQEADPRKSATLKAVLAETSGHSFFSSFVCSIEIWRDDDPRRRRLETVYFRKPDICNLREETRDAVLLSVNRSSIIAKHADFTTKADDLIFEMEYQFQIEQFAARQPSRWNPFGVLRCRPRPFEDALLVLALVSNGALMAGLETREGSLNLMTALFFVLLGLAQFCVSAYLVFIRFVLRLPQVAHRKKRVAREEDPFLSASSVQEQIALVMVGRNVMDVATERYTQFFATCMVASALGLFVSPFFYSFLLLIVLHRAPLLGNIVTAITLNGLPLLLTAFLGAIVVYYFSVAGYLFFSADFVKEAGQPGNCESLRQCFFFSLGNGLRGGGGIGEELVTNSWHSDTFFARETYDTLFFVCVAVIVMNIIFALIVDTFAELRDARNKVEEDMRTCCFICGIDDATFEREGELFKDHTKGPHNQWRYLYFFHHLRRKEISEFNGQESYVFGKLLNGDLSFFPVNRSKSLERGKTFNGGGGGGGESGDGSRGGATGAGVGGASGGGSAVAGGGSGAHHGSEDSRNLEPSMSSVPGGPAFPTLLEIRRCLEEVLSTRGGDASNSRRSRSGAVFSSAGSTALTSAFGGPPISPGQKRVSDDSLLTTGRPGGAAAAASRGHASPLSSAHRALGETHDQVLRALKELAAIV